MFETIKGKHLYHTGSGNNYMLNPQCEEKIQVITTQKVLFYTFNALCFKHFCVVVLHFYSNWHVKDLAMTSNHICG